ncbi:MAG: excinuclease ABC subunit C [Candidatus Doudnabacteria bacterium RIFCSPHIGHO2_01_FULL_46_14]|uniref:Excinuclease ABC subunit C n=1 Tax=Candidatus Doudnabacteria bacterium RIFCSPHIGHO2_01_FULL_46_14 TaxID=1817824 RepID=A0A1F5NNG7_9BACT|nr:MAG: excinuclease ABC subunit C [Candidatus Doudnabacteria bacterium RIFCSPHIGHO2_01_FULL_46_14]
MTNQNHSVLYIGVSNSLLRRGYEHKTKQSYHNSFTKKYNINKLVHYEEYRDIRDAIAREKQLKGGSRQKKIDLVNSMNPTWRDLYDEIHL